MEKEYKDIRYYPDYIVSETGEVFSQKYEGPMKELKQYEYRGYRRVYLSNKNQHKGFAVHRLVADAFIPNPDNKPFVNHKDGNRRNNHYQNLEWCTGKENQEHSRNVLGNTGRGAKNSNWGNRVSKFYPSQELRNRLIELGIPRHKHDIVSLGEMLPMSEQFKVPGGWVVRYHRSVEFWEEMADTEADARAKLLIYLLENKLI